MKRLIVFVAVILLSPPCIAQDMPSEAHMTRNGLSVQYLDVHCYCGENIPPDGYQCAQIPGGRCGINGNGKISARLELACPPGFIATGGAAAGAGPNEASGAWIRPQQIICQDQSISANDNSVHLHCSAACIEGN